jgi:hypothetical protein
MIGGSSVAALNVADRTGAGKPAARGLRATKAACAAWVLADMGAQRQTDRFASPAFSFACSDGRSDTVKTWRATTLGHREALRAGTQPAQAGFVARRPLAAASVATALSAWCGALP